MNGPPARMQSKVPEITSAFWVLKILTTGMGETSSDFLVHHLNPVVAVALGAGFFALSLVLQFRARRYIVAIYWFAVVMVSVFGTMAADVLHVVLGIPYVFSTVFYAVALGTIFLWWYRSERTLSIHEIYGGRREAFYWATILATFALGTAGGDMTATSLGWGYLASGLLFLGAIALPTIGRRWFGWGPIFAFWFAYVLTRPLGASFADWMGKPKSWGGLGWGEGLVSLGWGICILAFVAFMALSQREQRPKQRPRGGLVAQFPEEGS
ncbi:MAG: hypothetical protein ACP5O6_03515 [Candidatus Baltobacteraceae bacterium]